MTGKPKSATAVMATLKKELEAANPEQVLELVRSMKDNAIARQAAENLGPLGMALCLNRTGATRYQHSVLGVTGLEDLQRLWTAAKHFLQEVLEPQMQQIAVEAEVQRRLQEKEVPDG